MSTPAVSKPAVSVVLVSDYAGGEEKSWNDLHKTLQAISAQDLDEPFEVVLVEDARFRDTFPAALRESFSGLRVIFGEGASSYAMKNVGAQAAEANLTVMLDADCVPQHGWLRGLVRAIRAHPEALAVSARTSYAGRSLLERALGVLDRAYLDPGSFGRTRFVANNNAIYRTEAYNRNPLPEDAGPFASELQSEALLRTGGVLLFEPGAKVIHDFEGWGMTADIRRNAGYGTVVTRLRDGKIPHAWATRVGVAGIPLIIAGKIWKSWGICFRCRDAYGLKWHELPFTMALSVVVHCMEASGMAAAFSGRSIGETEYR